MITDTEIILRALGFNKSFQLYYYIETGEKINDKLTKSGKKKWINTLLSYEYAQHPIIDELLQYCTPTN